MRKFLLTAILMVVVSLPTLAKGSIKVECGDLSVINNPDITATVVFDYTNLVIEGKPYMEHLKSKGSDFVKDWPSESLTSETYFIKCWNHDNEDGLQVTATAGNEYKMVFDVSEMHMGSGAASMLVGFGAGGAKMSAMMYLFKGDNKVPVLIVKIDGQTGRSAMTELARRTDLYGELAEDLVEAIQKTKQSKVPASTKAVTIGIGESTTVAVKSTVLKPDQTVNKKNSKPVKNNIAQKESTGNKGVQEMLASAKGQEIPRRRKPILGDFDNLKGLKSVGVYLDFSDAEIMNRTEENFVRYMKTSADRRDIDKDFPNTWENDIKPELLSLFCSKVNEELKDEKLKTRLIPGTDFDYVLKLEVLEMDDDGNNTINFLFVNMSNGEVEAQIKCESKGGHVGRYIGLMQQGFESAAENFTKEFIDQID